MRIMKCSAHSEGKKSREAELGRYIEVFAARKKEMDLPKSVYPRWTTERSIFGRKMYQAPPFKPLPNTPMPPVHAPTPQFRFMALIESKVNVSSIITGFCLKKSPLGQEFAVPWLQRSGSI